MPLTDQDLHELLRSTDQHARNVMAQAAVLMDVKGRQLSVLRNTYPRWDIAIERDQSGRLIWIANLHGRATLEMVTAGVMPIIRQDDAIAMAATLAWQSAILYKFRFTT